MRHVFWILGVALAVHSTVAQSEESQAENRQGSSSLLSGIDRMIRKLPEFRTAKQLYGLMVLGPRASTRVWLVRDGETLYVDRNGNGDLTEEGERVEADKKWSEPSEQVYTFKAGNLADGPFQHKKLEVYWGKLSHLKDSDSRVKAAIKRDPEWRVCVVSLDVEMRGLHGNGIDGRIAQRVSWQDKNGLPEFAASPEAAPIMHFQGPLEIGFYSREPWPVGRTATASLAVGTPGVGPGSTVFTDYEGVVPPDHQPKLLVTFPSRNNGGPAEQQQTRTYTLTERCCGCNLYGKFDIPSNVTTGMARVNVSLPVSLSHRIIASSADEIEIIAAKPGPKLEPVSARLKQTLVHSGKMKSDSTLVAIQFSPDGQRIIAGSYPGGVVEMWDMKSGKNVSRIETGAGYRSTFNYFVVSPDGKTLIAPTNGKGRKSERIEKDEKLFYRWSFDDSLRVFDLENGSLVKSYQHTPPCEINRAQYIPESQVLITSDGLPGDYEDHYDRKQNAWTLTTGSHFTLPISSGSGLCFSGDGKIAASSKWLREDREDEERTIGLLETESWTKTSQILLPPGRIGVQPICFARQLLIGTITRYEKPNDFQKFTETLKFWDVVTGSEVHSIDAEPNTSITVSLSPDKRFLLMTNVNRDEKKIAVSVMDLATRHVREIQSWDNQRSSTAIIHPSSKWAVVTLWPDQAIVDEMPVEDLLQQRLHVIDLQQGRVAETLTPPQAFLLSMAFSPDGKTLATSGNGEVLLWDFSDYCE